MATPTYRDLLSTIAESAPDATSVCDLPDLSNQDLGTILKHNPLLFLEALADTDPDLAALCADRLDNIRKPSEVYAHIGLIVLGAIRAYVKPLLLRDVQALLERNREADSIEAVDDHGDTLTADQLMACEVGLGRSL